MIHLLVSDSNEKGALFARLMQDVFHALGYHDFRLSIAKAGRELDLRGKHRVEPRLAFAECKATKATIGGDSINKFVGALEAERNLSTDPITGYFVSLSGFKSSALTQEEEFSTPRIVLLSSEDIERELTLGRIVVPPEQAAAAAGSCCASEGASASALLGSPELLAWERGWVWCCYFGTAGEATGYVLVHADGQPLGAEAAAAVKAADESARGPLGALANLGNRRPHADTQTDTIKEAYLHHVAREYGDITIDGLPADESVGSQQIILEQLYVPLSLERAGDPQGEVDPDEIAFEDDRDGEPPDSTAIPADLSRVGIGTVLGSERSIAVLGPPGSGKSTLLKRLAVAYAAPERRVKIDDGLPDVDWLPLVLRCRQLPDDAEIAIRSLLARIPTLAEIEDEGGAFELLVSTTLADGKALVLVDGLDEIADDAARMKFVKQLRTFLGTYPAARVVVTSREAGFRVVAGAVSDVCQHYRVAAFDEHDILKLTRAWHRLVVGDSQAIEREADELARAIYTTDRVRQLAINPLLLTTLLLVRRWIGELPRKRTVLYSKAIEVLLMTWNVEGHEPIDLEEAMPQLAYLAYSMTASKRQSLSLQEMRDLLRQAREDLPEVLAYARTTPGNFVERVEERSSLLSLSGHAIQDGTLTAMYEFKHLTFQEYLTAVACVNGYVPGGSIESSLPDQLSSYFHESSWREIIPLAAVLAGRRAGPLVQALCEEAAKGEDAEEDRTSWLPAVTLAHVLADEALLAPPLVDLACVTVARTERYSVQLARVLPEILTSRYGERFEEVTTGLYHGKGGKLGPEAGAVYAMLLVSKYLGAEGGLRSGWHEILAKHLAQRGDEQAQARGALMLMDIAFTNHLARRDPTSDAMLPRLAESNESALNSPYVPVQFAAAWAYAWLGHVQDWIEPSLAVRVAPRILELWRRADLPELQSMAAWAFSELPLWNESVELEKDPGLFDFLRSQWSASPERIRREDRRPAALLAGHLLKGPWDQEELWEMGQELGDHVPIRRFAAALGRSAPVRRHRTI